jgi:NIMA (never in mitosis gene a)-related kinase
MSVIKDSEGVEYIIYNESELYDDNEMGNQIDDFEILQILGKGSYGLVAKIRSKKNKKIYALKQIDLSKINTQKEKDLCKREIILLNQLDHPNINKYYKSIINDNIINTIMEFMNNGDLKGFIEAHKKFNKPVREEEVWNILLQSMNGLKYIHERDIIHRDIKPANLFMTNDKTIKIGDFGVSAKVSAITTSVRENCFNGTVVGTPVYMSPEMINNEEYDQKTDVYSMGVTIYELCFFTPPRKAIPNIEDGNIVFLPLKKTANENVYSKELLDIIDKMIEIDQNKRPTSEEICEMVRKEYTKTFLKTSSLSSVVRCLYSLPRFNKSILNSQNSINNNANSKRVIKGFLDIILKLQKNINNEFNGFKEILATEYPKLNSDEEMEPRFLVALLLEKMHKEVNVIQKRQNNEEQYIINSTFNGQDEDKSKKAEMIEKFVNHFIENFNSVISNYFFGMLKEMKTCDICSTISYNFGCFCLLSFDLDEICGGAQNNNVSLNDLFSKMNNKVKKYTIKDKVYCDTCLSYQNHSKIKRLYTMPYELIISLERGLNCMNKTMINFPMMLDVTDYVESQVSPKKFNFMGSVNRVDIKGKEHYISFCKDLNSNNWLCSDDDKINITSPNNALTTGLPILLFYSCN